MASKNQSCLDDQKDVCSAHGEDCVICPKEELKLESEKEDLPSSQNIEKKEPSEKEKVARARQEKKV